MLSLFFTPVVGFIVALAAPVKQATQPVINNNNYYNPQAQQHTEKSAGQHQPVQPDKFQVLEKLAALRAQGVLSEEEFQREKSKVLNS